MEFHPGRSEKGRNVGKTTAEHRACDGHDDSLGHLQKYETIGWAPGS